MDLKNNLGAQSEGRKQSGLLFFIWNNVPRLALIIFIAVIFFLFGTIGEKKAKLEAAKKEEHVEQKKLVNAILLQLQPRTIHDVINLPGTIEPWSKLDLLAKVKGAIVEVLVEEGDSVQAGDVLARIEEDDYRIALDAARAAYTLAKSEFTRNQAMLKKRVIPSASLETSETALLKAQTDLEQAKLQLSRCLVTAPISCVVNRIDAKVGAFLSVGDPLAQLLQMDQVKGVVGIPESDVAAVRKVKQVDITISALENKQFTAKAHFFSPAPETTAYLYRFELALENLEHEILPGMFLRANIVKERVDNAIMVPLYAIISRSDKQFVYVVDGDKVRRQPVELGIIEGWQIQVTNGLVSGDEIVIEGHRDVDDGQQINIVKVITDPAERLL